MIGSMTTATRLADPTRLRERIRRYSLFLVLNRDAGTRRVLEGLIRQAEAQLAISLSSQGRIVSDEAG